jgi:F420-dependent oxidoreductase-like protein
MVAISLMIEGQMGLTWPRWQQIAAEVEAAGFAGLFRSDHFTNPQPPAQESLETIVSLTYLASHTQRIHFGQLVSPVSFRDPIMPARQAAAIDDLSGGRLWLGVGTGWQEREHHLFGYDLGDMSTRFARLEEALEVITRLLRDAEPEPFAGRFYQLRAGACLLPRPQRPGGPRLVVGGNGPKRTLPLAARYANVWNAIGLEPATFRERSARLDELLVAQGRQPADVRRTMMTSQIIAPDRATLEQKLRRQAPPELADRSLDELLQAQRQDGWYKLVGTPEMVAGQLAACQDAGVEELMLQWFDLDDMAGLRAFAEQILPPA